MAFLVYYLKSSPFLSSLSFNDIVVTKVNGQKHLGLTFDKISLSKNLSMKKLKLLKKLSHISQYHPTKLYKILIRTHFDYCDIIYHIPPIFNPYSRVATTLNYLMERLAKIQYQAALAITGTWHGPSLMKRWDGKHFPIDDGIDVIIWLLIISEISCHLLEDLCTYARIPCRITKYKNRFSPNAIKIWNCLTENIQACTSLNNLERPNWN